LQQDTYRVWSADAFSGASYNAVEISIIIHSRPMNKEQACIMCTVEATQDALTQAHNPVLCRPPTSA